MKHLRLIIGIIFVVASLLKLATVSGLIHIGWLERVSDEHEEGAGLELVFDEGLHGLVAGQSQVVVSTGGVTVAVFGPLPEQPLVVA